MTETPAIKDADNPVPLDWGHEIDEVHAGGLEIQRKATAAECAALARALDILQCDSLDVSYRLRRAPAEGFGGAAAATGAAAFTGAGGGAA